MESLLPSISGRDRVQKEVKEKKKMPALRDMEMKLMLEEEVDREVCDEMDYVVAKRLGGEMDREVKEKKGDASSIGGFEGYGDEADADSAETQFSRHCPHFSGPSSSSLMINNN